jgi:hypothetical protein
MMQGFKLDPPAFEWGRKNAAMMTCHPLPRMKYIFIGQLSGVPAQKVNRGMLVPKGLLVGISNHKHISWRHTSYCHYRGLPDISPGM